LDLPKIVRMLLILWGYVQTEDMKEDGIKRIRSSLKKTF